VYSRAFLPRHSPHRDAVRSETQFVVRHSRVQKRTLRKFTVESAFPDTLRDDVFLLACPVTFLTVAYNEIACLLYRWDVVASCVGSKGT
jgi:hypothetical protein